MANFFAYASKRFGSYMMAAEPTLQICIAEIGACNVAAGNIVILRYPHFSPMDQPSSPACRLAAQLVKCHGGMASYDPGQRELTLCVPPRHALAADALMRQILDERHAIAPRLPHDASTIALFSAGLLAYQAGQFVELASPVFDDTPIEINMRRIPPSRSRPDQIRFAWVVELSGVWCAHLCDADGMPPRVLRQDGFILESVKKPDKHYQAVKHAYGWTVLEAATGKMSAITTKEIATTEAAAMADFRYYSLMQPLKTRRARCIAEIADDRYMVVSDPTAEIVNYAICDDLDDAILTASLDHDLPHSHNRLDPDFPGLPASYGPVWYRWVLDWSIVGLWGRMGAPQSWKLMQELPGVLHFRNSPIGGDWVYDAREIYPWFFADKLDKFVAKNDAQLEVGYYRRGDQKKSFYACIHPAGVAFRLVGIYGDVANGMIAMILDGISSSLDITRADWVVRQVDESVIVGIRTTTPLTTPHERWPTTICLPTIDTNAPVGSEFLTEYGGDILLSKDCFNHYFIPKYSYFLTNEPPYTSGLVLSDEFIGPKSMDAIGAALYRSL